MNSLSDELVREIRAKLNSDDIKLPSLPATIIKVQTLLADDDYSVADISKILIGDSAFATVVMRIANSARFNTSGKEIRNMNIAIQRIGTGNILKLLIGIASKLFFKVKQPELRQAMQKAHDRTLLVSAAAEQVARTTQTANPADTFMAALLHDQGRHVLVACIPEDLMAMDCATRAEIYETFRREMGARLLFKWQLPEEFILVAQHHGIESPDRPNLPMLDCLDIGDKIVHNMTDANNGKTIDFSNFSPSKRLRLSETQATGIIMDVEDHIEELRLTFAT
ncbi:MAG: HDOD domain-containing protein [Mariprofundaceae bacterium]|nr:HDOD domain-containing protein [Mariprofundaceae bacterium]